MTKATENSRYLKPTKIWGNLYFVGTRAVSTHLIDTNDGLMILDPGYAEDLHIVLNNIRELGFQTEDIKYIVVSHGHYDHMDSVSELVAITHAKTFIGKGDLPLLTGETYHYPIKSFEPDVLLEDGDVISLGNTNITCIATPGHTDGTMSFFFDVTDGERVYRAGMFGGAGSNTLRKDFMLEHNIPFSARNTMVESILKIKGERVEIFLGNHPENNKTEEKLNRLENSVTNPFIEHSQQEWNLFLEERLHRMYQIINENL